MRLRLTHTAVALILLALSALPSSVVANAYAQVIERDFWGALYKDGGATFYCAKEFSKKTPLIAESHIYSTANIREHLQCGTNRQCKKNPEYQKIISDLHNIVPADSYFEFKRKSSVFGILDASVEANECGIRKRFQVIEPKDSIKGDIARVISYMSTTYNLPLRMTVADVKLWNELDPPDEVEISRNNKVKALQGNSNQFVESPALINDLEN